METFGKNDCLFVSNDVALVNSINGPLISVTSDDCVGPTASPLWKGIDDQRVLNLNYDCRNLTD